MGYGAVAAARGSRGTRRLALVLANGAYVNRAPLSRPIPVSAELRGKLEKLGFAVEHAENQGLEGMLAATKQWLEKVADAAAALSDTEEGPHREGCKGLGRSQEPPLLLFLVFCGHGSAGKFFPVDCGKPVKPEETFCFFKNLLLPLLEVLAADGRSLEHSCSTYVAGRGRPFAADAPEGLQWRLAGVKIVVIIESCRRLSGAELKAFEEERARIAHSRRHLLPSVAALRPDLGPLGGADWDAARMSFFSSLGPGSPDMLLALSSESTTPSYDVVFLRGIVEALDKPVKLSGIFERASLDTLRRTGHKQKPVVLTLGVNGRDALQDLVLAPAAPPPGARSCLSLPGCGREPRRLGSQSRACSLLPVLS